MRHPLAPWLSLLPWILLSASSPAAGESADDLAREHETWKSWRLERLTSETSWLTLIGLHWIEEGEHRLGSAPGSELPLPADRAPALVGVVRRSGTAVELRPDPGVELLADGEPLSGPIALWHDAESRPVLVELGPVNFFLVRRGDRIGLRVRDREARLRREFAGLEYFAFDPRYRVAARFEPNPEGTTIPMANVLGMVEPVPSPGRVRFVLDGTEHTLVALDDTGDGRLFLIVGDATNGRETYGAGRYLYADPPRDGETIIDLNRLYNPPCAFTPYSTCQLPPRENRLERRIEAGEKKYAGSFVP
jgi:uncharacterized protein